MQTAIFGYLYGSNWNENVWTYTRNKNKKEFWEWQETKMLLCGKISRLIVFVHVS